jgi:2-dehydro-3-deoxyphosphogalactonate aldolase
LMLAPNVDPLVLQRAIQLELITVPGIFTATEALLAIQAGASALKIFPASILGPSGIKAISAILPDKTVMSAVGGVSEKNFAAYKSAGVNTFGLGSSLYSPGDSLKEIRDKAANVIQAYDDVFGNLK